MKTNGTISSGNDHEAELLVGKLFVLQASSGAFESTVRFGDRCLSDHNGFITALVIRETAALEGPGWLRVRQRALDYIEECESPFSPGRFSFWPRTRWPPWIPPIPEDCDCTATIASVLLDFGRIDIEKAEVIATKSLLRCQLADGAFVAWQYNGGPENPVDLVLNANVIAFLAQIGWFGRNEFERACDVLCGSVAACISHPGRLRALTPYYPNPKELGRAVNYAVKRGALRLRETAAQLCLLTKALQDSSSCATVFTTLDGSTHWSSSALEIAREITGS